MGFFADFKAKRADKRASQEFDYLYYVWQEDIAQLDKLLMLSTTPDESDYFISVSNRKATSDVRFKPEVGREFNRFLGSATAALESGIARLLEELESLKEKATTEELKLVLPSSAKVILESH